MVFFKLVITLSTGPSSITLPGAYSLLKLYILYFPCSDYFFSLYIYIRRRVVANKPAMQSKPWYLDISFAKTKALGKFFGQRRKAAHSMPNFTKFISRSLTNILSLRYFLSQASTIQISLSIVCHSHSRMVKQCLLKESNGFSS